MITLCSLWDSAYNAKGKSLIGSLCRHAPDGFMLYVLALDGKVWDALTDVRIPGVMPIWLSEIETPTVLAAKANRSATEYIWTLGSVFTWWCVDTFEPDSIAYIDADCYLFNSLDALYNEVNGFPVAITPHRYTPSQKARLQGAGIYNVGWVYFEKTGFDCLWKWRNDCLAWCYHRIERDGRFADQGYLNDWPQQWRAHVVRNLGVNLAPWNQEQYRYEMNGDGLIVSDGQRDDKLLLYHFHGFEGIGKRTGYPLHPMVAKHVYEPYEGEYANHGRMG